MVQRGADAKGQVVHSTGVEVEGVGRLDGKVAIVTGASQGQGETHARRFAAEGAKVILADILVKEGEAIAAELAGSAMFVRHDVTESESWDELVRSAEERFGPVTVLINNAAIDLQSSLESTSEEQYRRVIDVNQVSVFLGMKAVIASMRRAGVGSIINISSIVGTNRVSRDRVAYVSAKFAMRGMTKVAAVELAVDGIRVNTVLPGFIDTPMLAASKNSAERLAQVPLNRPARPEEVTSLVLFLASDEASYLTGAEYLVDGGFCRGF